MPTSSELRSSGRSNIEGAITKYHRGYHDVGKKLGYKNITSRPRGYWSDFSNLKNELLPICKELGRMPTRSELISTGRSNIDSAIGTHHGGYHDVGKKLGYKDVRKRPNGYWSDFSNLKNELVPICESVEVDSPLFTGRNGGHCAVITLMKSYKRAIEESYLPLHFSIHSARHTYATFLLHATNNLRYVQKQLGHRKISMTALYADVLPSENGNLANKIRE